MGQVQVTTVGEPLWLDIELAAWIAGSATVFAKEGVGRFLLIRTEDYPGVGIMIGAGVPLRVDIESDADHDIFREHFVTARRRAQTAFPDEAPFPG